MPPTCEEINKTRQVEDKLNLIAATIDTTSSIISDIVEKLDIVLTEDSSAKMPQKTENPPVSDTRLLLLLEDLHIRASALRNQADHLSGRISI